MGDWRTERLAASKTSMLTPSLLKEKELFEKRSIVNVRQFGVDGRKTLFLLLLLFDPCGRLLRADAAASRRTCVRARAADHREEIGNPLFMIQSSRND